MITNSNKELRLDRLRQVREQEKSLSLARREIYRDKVDECKRSKKEVERQKKIESKVEKHGFFLNALQSALVDTGKSHRAATLSTFERQTRSQQQELMKRIQKQRVDDRGKAANKKLLEEAIINKEAATRLLERSQRVLDIKNSDREDARQAAESRKLQTQSVDRLDKIQSRQAALQSNTKIVTKVSQDAVSILDRKPVVINAKIIRHSDVNDPHLIQNEVDNEREKVMKNTWNSTMKELQSEFATQRRKEVAKAALSLSKFSNLEKELKSLVDIDRSGNRMFREKNIKMVGKKCSREKDLDKLFEVDILLSMPVEKENALTTQSFGHESDDRICHPPCFERQGPFTNRPIPSTWSLPSDPMPIPRKFDEHTFDFSTSLHPSRQPSENNLDRVPDKELSHRKSLTSQIPGARNSFFTSDNDYMNRDEVEVSHLQEPTVENVLYHKSVAPGKPVSELRSPDISKMISFNVMDGDNNSCCSSSANSENSSRTGDDLKKIESVGGKGGKERANICLRDPTNDIRNDEEHGFAPGSDHRGRESPSILSERIRSQKTFSIPTALSLSIDSTKSIDPISGASIERSTDCLVLNNIGLYDISSLSTEIARHDTSISSSQPMTLRENNNNNNSNNNSRNRNSFDVDSVDDSSHSIPGIVLSFQKHHQSPYKPLSTLSASSARSSYFDDIDSDDSKDENKGYKGFDKKDSDFKQDSQDMQDSDDTESSIELDHNYGAVNTNNNLNSNLASTFSQMGVFSSSIFEVKGNIEKKYEPKNTMGRLGNLVGDTRLRHSDDEHYSRQLINLDQHFSRLQVLRSSVDSWAGTGILEEMEVAEGQSILEKKPSEFNKHEPLDNKDGFSVKDNLVTTSSSSESSQITSYDDDVLGVKNLPSHFMPRWLENNNASSDIFPPQHNSSAEDISIQSMFDNGISHGHTFHDMKFQRSNLPVIIPLPSVKYDESDEDDDDIMLDDPVITVKFAGIGNEFPFKTIFRSIDASAAIPDSSNVDSDGFSISTKDSDDSGNDDQEQRQTTLHQPYLIDEAVEEISDDYKDLSNRQHFFVGLPLTNELYVSDSFGSINNTGSFEIPGKVTLNNHNLLSAVPEFHSFKNEHNESSDLQYHDDPVPRITELSAFRGAAMAEEITHPYIQSSSSTNVLKTTFPSSSNSRSQLQTSAGSVHSEESYTKKATSSKDLRHSLKESYKISEFINQWENSSLSSSSLSSSRSSSLANLRQMNLTNASQDSGTLLKESLELETSTEEVIAELEQLSRSWLAKRSRLLDPESSNVAHNQHSNRHCSAVNSPLGEKSKKNIINVNVQGNNNSEIVHVMDSDIFANTGSSTGSSILNIQSTSATALPIVAGSSKSARKGTSIIADVKESTLSTKPSQASDAAERQKNISSHFNSVVLSSSIIPSLCHSAEKYEDSELEKDLKESYSETHQNIQNKISKDQNIQKEISRLQEFVQHDSSPSSCPSSSPGSFLSRGSIRNAFRPAHLFSISASTTSTAGSSPSPNKNATEDLSFSLLKVHDTIDRDSTSNSQISIHSLHDSINSSVNSSDLGIRPFFRNIYVADEDVSEGSLPSVNIGGNTLNNQSINQSSHSEIDFNIDLTLSQSDLSVSDSI